MTTLSGPVHATFSLTETTIADLHAAYLAGTTTCREVTQAYLARIEAYDLGGPGINSVVTVAPDALAQADALDAALADGGLVGPLHGVPVLVKDQVDTVGMPTTLGSELFRDYVPDQDATATRLLKEAGALILAKTTLGEMGGGDTHGTLFGSTRNPYDLERTPGGSSGGSAAAVSANLGAVAIGQEGLASIRRPSAWNATVGMRPSLGLVSRAGAFGGWPRKTGSLGPMTRTVEDAARVLDVLVGYDPEDPSTASGVGRTPSSFVAVLDPDGLRGTASESLAAFARASVSVRSPALRTTRGSRLSSTRPSRSWSVRALGQQRVQVRGHVATQRRAGTGLVRQCRGERGGPGAAGDEPADPDGRAPSRRRRARHDRAQPDADPGRRQPAVRQPEGSAAPDTILSDVPAISVPAGFTSEDLPVGITFLGRSFSDVTMVRYAYAFEQATQHRKPPACAPELP